ncbi:hypothetical protein ABZ949_17230 [Micromonospora tulbaghiae]|uniref:hypothetical protein n=1 Tax=Micromonospora tulbaghiae TaxID=479978 RepID=UPI0013C4EF9B|nr:hypothetical protein [Micromonospora tulbaghiae]
MTNSNSMSNRHAIRVANCWPSGIGAVWSGDQLPCVTNPNKSAAKNADFELPVGSSTINYSYYYDTDAFRVYKGCSVAYQFEGTSTIHSESAPTTSKWLRITGIARAKILTIRC